MVNYCNGLFGKGKKYIHGKLDALWDLEYNGEIHLLTSIPCDLSSLFSTTALGNSPTHPCGQNLRSLSSSTLLWWEYSSLVEIDSGSGVQKDCSPSGSRIHCPAQCICHPSTLSSSNWTSHTRIMAQSERGTFRCSTFRKKATEGTWSLCPRNCTIVWWKVFYQSSN